MWIALRFKHFELDQLPCLPLIKINSGKMIGFLPVYATLKDAVEEWPDGPFQEIAKEEPR